MVDAGTKLSRLMQVMREKAYIENEEKALSAPMVEDLDFLGNIYDIFSVSLLEVNPNAHPDSFKSRKKFLFVVLYVFSPSTLVGKKLRAGIRNKVSDVLGYVGPNNVSHLAEDLLFLYSNYQVFKRDVDYILGKVDAYLSDYTKKV